MADSLFETQEHLTKASDNLETVQHNSKSAAGLAGSLGCDGAAAAATRSTYFAERARADAQAAAWAIRNAHRDAVHAIIDLM